MAEKFSASSFAKGIAEIFIKGIEDGSLAKWQQEYQTAKGAMPINPTTNNEYKGANKLKLLLELMSKNSQDPRYLTFNQIKELGGKINKGEHGTPCIFWKMVDSKEISRLKDKFTNGEELTEEEQKILNSNEKQIPVCNKFVVFNISQTTGLIEKLGEHKFDYDKTEWNTDERIENLIKNIGAEVQNTPILSAPNYNSSSNKITMPLRDQFKDAGSYYSVLLHELAHWTGPKNRLNRSTEINYSKGNNRAKEELVAEISAFMLCTELGIKYDDTNSKAYVKSWSQLLADKPTEILKACTEAEKVLNYVLQYDQKIEQEQKTEQTESQNIKDKTSEILKGLKVTLKDTIRDLGIKKGTTLESENAYTFLKGLVKLDHDLHFHDGDPKKRYAEPVKLSIEFNNHRHNLEFWLGDHALKGDTVAEAFPPLLHEKILNPEIHPLEVLQKTYPEQNWTTKDDVRNTISFCHNQIDILGTSLKLYEARDPQKSKIEFKPTLSWNVKITSAPKAIDKDYVEINGQKEIYKQQYEFKATTPNNKEVIVKKWAYEHEAIKLDLKKDAELKITGFYNSSTKEFTAIDVVKEKLPEIKHENITELSEPQFNQKTEKKSEEKIYIRVNYNNKDIVKALAGAKYLAPLKLWTVPKASLVNATTDIKNFAMYKTKADIFAKKEISASEKESLLGQKEEKSKVLKQSR